MNPTVRERFVALIFFALYCGAVALRELFSRPWELRWCIGLVAAAACMFTLGYIYRAGHNRRRAQRAARHPRPDA